ncbi:MAG: YicC family protein [Oscillospiraceae bacterium]|nr:YicC family protein [Oscillospiraceae bacterium]MBR4691692.1 YicC family protein [Oscillospiraceae bacterium]
MTGYGTASGSSGKLALTVEMKSVNNRFLDVSVRLPRLYSFAEEPLKALVQKSLIRGKVDVFVNIDASKDDSVVVRLNEPVLKAYLEAVREMREQYGIPDDAGTTAFSRMPDVFITEKVPVDAEAFTADLMETAGAALAVIREMRSREGDRLEADILGKLEELEGHRQFVARRSPQSVEEYRTRLLNKMREILESTDIDESRILTEAALYADKVAVDEELVRLDSHIRQFRELLAGGGAVGRKLDFLIQELNREVNTIGSKCTDLEITKTVLEMKACIEKLREQVQNIE